MNFKTIISIVLIVLNLTLAALLYRKNHEVNQLNISLHERSNEIGYLMQRDELLQFCYETESSSNHFKIKDNIELISIKHDTISLFEYINQFDREVMILHFSINNCHTCIQDAYKHFEDLALKDIPVLVIAHFDHFHNFYNHYLSMDSNVPTYWTLKPISGFNQEIRYNFPFVFITDNTFFVRRFHIPRSEFPNRNNHYFNSIY